MCIYGYVRVSSKDQIVDRQLKAMLDEGIKEENIFIEKESGKDFNRPIYRKMISCLTKKDVVCIKSLDRLGRNYDEMLEEWRQITKVIGANIYILDIPLLDTRKNKDLLGDLIADLFLHILSYVAETERDFIKQRQAEGIAAARERGVHLGRPPVDLPPDFNAVKERWLNKEITVEEAARCLKMSSSSFHRYAKKVI